MEGLYSVLSWGSPVGIGLMLFLTLGGTGIFFWGISQLTSSNAQDEDKS